MGKAFIREGLFSIKRFGRCLSLLMLPLIVEIIFSASMSFFFNDPPIWSFEVTLFLYGSMFMLGGAYCHLEKNHVAVEVFLPYMSQRWKKLSSVFSEIVVLFVVAVLFYISVPVVYRSFVMAERSMHQTPFDPRIWPYRLVIPMGSLLIIYQCLHDIYALIKCGPLGSEKVRDDV